MGGQRAVGRDRPALDRALVVVGDAAPDARPTRGSPLSVGDVGGRDQAGDLGGDRRRRVAALLLPALGAERRAVGDDEVRRRLDVVGVEGVRRSCPAGRP